MPKGRVFPTSRDDFVECAALMRSVRRGELDAIVAHDTPLDVLAQQIVAEVACQEYTEDDLFALARRAWVYRDLSRPDFDAVVAMVAEGFATRRGRRARCSTATKSTGSAFTARIEVAGADLRRGDSRDCRLPCGPRAGRDLHRHDQRGLRHRMDGGRRFSAWQRVVACLAGRGGHRPRSGCQRGASEYSLLAGRGAGAERRAVERGQPAPRGCRSAAWNGAAVRADRTAPSAVRIVDWFIAETGVGREGAEQALSYLADARRVLGILPTQHSLVLERFFDESGGMQLVLHAPFGSRVNKAWGLALRKRFCRQFNFELQAAATDDALMLSLGPQHSFPLSDVFRYLHPETARDVLVQAFLDAPMFETRWRWNSTLALAVPRNRGGRKVPPQVQRMLAADLLASVFPDAAACLENIPGDREIPDHPLVSQTVRDCLEEAMDIDGLPGVLGRIHRGELQLVARDTPGAIGARARDPQRQAVRVSR